jgi:antitoxin VapB
MALSIKNSETERLAREIAKETGESITEAIQKSLQERMERLHKEQRRRMVRAEVDDMLRRIDALTVLDPRTPDEIIGYDERGLPGKW